MLIASYTQQVHLREVSLYSKAVLVLAILFGSNVPLEYFLRQQPALAPLNTLVWFGLYIAALSDLLFRHGVNWISWLIRYRVLLVLLLTGSLLLTPWSVDPPLSVNRLTHLLGTTLIAVYIGFSLPINRVLTLFSSTLFVLLILSLLTSQLLADYAWEIHSDSLALKGIMDNKNTLGFWAAMALLLFPWSAAQQPDLFARLFWGCSTLMALVILLQSRSAGSMIAIMAAMSVVGYFMLVEKLRLGFLAMALLATLSGILLVLFISGLDIAELTGRSDDLTGRTEVWGQTWSLIQQRPLSGYGYGTLWFPTDATRWIQERYTDFTWLVYHAHNGALQIASEIGLPLSALALLFVIQQLVELVFYQLRRPQSATLLTLGFTVAFLISNYSEARFLQSRELFWLFYLALPICIVRQVEFRTLSGRRPPVPARAQDRQLRYPDEFIPGANTKLGKLRAAKRARRLRRESLSRLAAPRPSERDSDSASDDSRPL